MSKLKSVADDLSAFLSMNASAKTESKKPTIIKGPITEEVSAREIIRAAFDYVTAKLTEADEPQTIGEAFIVAVGAVAHDAGIDRDEAVQEAIAFLEEIVNGARETM